MMAQWILACIDALVAKRLTARTEELGRYLVGDVIVGDEADLALGVRLQDLTRRAQLDAGSGRGRIERLGLERLGRGQAGIDELAGTGHDADARRAGFDPQLDHL